MNAPVLSTRFLGNCQLCERDQKVDGGLMVHHGYKRPGHGYIEGDCPGVHQPPYEVSCDLVIRAKVAAEDSLESSKAWLVKLEAGEVSELFIEARYTVFEETSSRGGLAHLFVGVTHPWHWEKAVDGAIARVKYRIDDLETHRIPHLTARIAAWKPMPIRTVEEEVVKQAGLRAERAKAVAERRALRAAKVAATRAKVAVLAAKRKAMQEELEAKFVALAATPATGLRDAGARELARVLKTRKFSWLWAHHLTCTDALVTLGLVVRSAEGRLSYRF